MPKVGSQTYVAQSAEVVGDVTIGNFCYIGPGSKIRGDYGTVEIGDRTSIQENCVVHTRVGGECKIGSNVTVGHGAIIHGATVKDNVIIGMGAIVSDDVAIQDWCIIGPGCVVPDRKQIDEGSLVLGIPGKVKRVLTEQDRTRIEAIANIYADLAPRYLNGLTKL